MQEHAVLQLVLLVVVIGGGEGDNDTIDYVQIMTTGNAIDFGNLTQIWIWCWCIKWSWRFIMSEFRVNSITNQDGSAVTASGVWCLNIQWKVWCSDTKWVNRFS